MIANVRLIRNRKGGNMIWPKFEKLVLGDKITNLASLSVNPTEDIIEGEVVAFDQVRKEVIFRYNAKSISLLGNYRR